MKSYSRIPSPYVLTLSSSNHHDTVMPLWFSSSTTSQHVVIQSTIGEFINVFIASSSFARHYMNETSFFIVIINMERIPKFKFMYSSWHRRVVMGRTPRLATAAASSGVVRYIMSQQTGCTAACGVRSSLLILNPVLYHRVSSLSLTNVPDINNFFT